MEVTESELHYCDLSIPCTHDRDMEVRQFREPSLAPILARHITFHALEEIVPGSS